MRLVPLLALGAAVAAAPARRARRRRCGVAPVHRRNARKNAAGSA